MALDKHSNKSLNLSVESEPEEIQMQIIQSAFGSDNTLDNLSRESVHFYTHNAKPEGLLTCEDDSSDIEIDVGSERSGLAEEFDEGDWWFKHPRIQDSCKKTIAAAGLMFAGIVIFIIAIILTVASKSDYFAIFFIAAAICFIPGAYHIAYLYLYVRGRPGFQIHHLPIFA